MIQLTPDQRQAFRQGNPVRLHDPELGAEVVVCPAEFFEQLIEAVEDEKEQQEWLKMSLRTLGQRVAEEEA